MRSGMVGVGAAMALLLLATPVLAAEGTLSGRAAMPLRLHGEHEVTGAGQFLVAGDTGQLSLLLQGAGTVTVVTQRAFGVVDGATPKAQVLWQQRVETEQLDLDGALLSLKDRQPRFQALAYDGEGRLANGPRDGPVALGLLAKSLDVQETLQAPLSVQVLSEVQPFHQRIPSGLYASMATDGRVTFDGAFKVFLSEAVLEYFGADGQVRTIRAHFHEERRPGSLYNPVDNTWFGAGDHPEYIQEYVVVEAKAGHLDLQDAGLPGTLYVARPEATVLGTAILPRMDGAIRVTDKEETRTHALRGQDLSLSGRFTLAPHHPDKSTTQVDGAGDFTTVSYGAVTAHYDWAGTAVAVGLGALVLAGIAWATANGKALFGSLGAGLVAGYARVHGNEVLEHPGRAEVYERVKAFPGVNFVQLSAQVHFGASTLNYHLRVLERNGYITSVRDGRYLRFFDRTTGSYAGARKMAVSALRNETTAAMAKHIRDHPGIAQCDLAAAFGVTPSTVTWHINRLASQGLVQKVREAQHTRYYIGEGWASLPLDEQLRQSGTVQAPQVVAIA